MNIKPRWRSRSGLFNGYSCTINCDKNGMFIIRQCILYVGRFLSCYPLLDRETWDIVQWLIPDENENIIQIVTDSLSTAEKNMFKDEIKYATKSPERYPQWLSIINDQVPAGTVREITAPVLQLLEKKHRQLQYRGRSDSEKGLASLKQMFKLTDAEVDFTRLYFISKKCLEVTRYFESHLGLFNSQDRTYLQAVLNMDSRKLTAVLTGTLHKIGALVRKTHETFFTNDFLCNLESQTTENLAAKYFTRIPRQTIPLTCHQIGQNETDHILRLMMNKSKTSTHLLLYGRPGTGKTSYACGLARQLNLPAYRIVHTEENQTATRRMAIIACRNMTGSGDGALIIVDEADNILNTRLSGFTRGETQDKGWLNQFLEEPGARMIWITNTIDDIEESVLRRFAYSLHFEELSRRQRTRLWEGILENNRAQRFFTPENVEKMVTHHPASAGVIDLAVKKAREMKLRSPEKFQEAVALSLNAHERLIAGGDRKIERERIDRNYSLDGLNIHGDMAAMMQRLEAFDAFLRRPEQTEYRNMNLLFYGPSGTGKSELARYIAERLHREVICRRAGDILDSLVGGTEKNIRNTFAEAEREQAVLVFDEADSFLFNREMAGHSWEISFTNEFLTRMERYRGILVCTTNRMSELDIASFRRFNHKIGLHYLKPEGNVIFYQKLLAPLTTVPLQPAEENDLKAISTLTPGDFRIVRDTFILMPADRITPQAMIDDLHRESLIKQVHRGEKSIGFMH